MTVFLHALLFKTEIKLSIRLSIQVPFPKK